MVVGEPSVLMRREIYVTAAVAGACLYVVLEYLGINPVISAGAAAFAAFSCAAARFISAGPCRFIKASPAALKKNSSATRSSGQNNRFR